MRERLSGARNRKYQGPHLKQCGPHFVRKDLPIYRRDTRFRLRRLDEAELGQCGDTVIKTDLLLDLSADHFQHGRAGEVHLTTCRSGEAADQKIFEGRTRVGASTLPLTDDVIAFG